MRAGAADAGMRAGAADAGLTLIETLVVLAIVGVTSGAAVLALAPPRGGTPQAEAQRLARAIQRAADATMLDDAPAALVADARGYAVTHGAGDAVRHDLPAGMAIAGSTAAPVAIGLGDTGAIDLTVERGDDHWAVRYDGLRAVAMPAEARR